MIKQLFLPIGVVICCHGNISAQLLIDPTPTPEELVQQLLGPGVTASNVTLPVTYIQPWPWTGSASFTAAGTNLGIDAGIMLASGAVEYAIGPDTLSSQSYLYTNGDDDLTALIGGTPGTPNETKDAAVLEFDFVPNGDSIKFRYVFASEEYPEWVCSYYNDVFGFFLSGPGINGPYSNNSMNIALIPGTTIPVAINSVNSGQVGGSTFPYDPAVCAQTDPNWTNNSGYFVDNVPGEYLSYDGFTVVLEAAAAVQCGETYHIKLAIADMVDRFFDSAVFLEAGSFSSVGGSGAISLVPGIGISGDTLTEGCPVEFLVQRAGDLTAPATMDLVVSGTATAGIDYEPAFPSQINFAAGEASQAITVNVPIDGDPLEDIVITLVGVMACADSTNTEFTFYISPSEPLLVELADVSSGCDGEAVLDPVISGGTGDPTFLWSTGDTTMSITVQPAIDTEYELTVSDGCGVQPVWVSAMVTLDAVPIELTVSPAVEVPCGDEVQIEVIEITGGTAPYSFQWTANGISAGTDQVINVTGGPPTWYVVTVMDTCNAIVMDSVLVSALAPDPLIVTASEDLQVPCQQEGEISVINVEGGDGNYTYTWTQNDDTIGTGLSITVSGGPPLIYVATVVDGCGATGQDSVLVSAEANTDLTVTATPNTNVTCAGDSVLLEVLDVQGATGQLTYAWTNTAGQVIGTAASIEVLVMQDEQFLVTLIDECGNTGDASINVDLDLSPLQLQLTEDLFICAGEQVDLFATVTGGSGAYFIDWQDQQFTDPILTVSPTQTTQYTVTITDQCGQTITETVTVHVENVQVDILENNNGPDDWHLVAVTSPPASNYIWNMGDGTLYRDREVHHSYGDLDDHWVFLQVTTPNGCMATDSLLLLPPANVSFPNAFTPDGDGFNDLFGAVGHSIEKFELEVFNRWGELIFHSDSPEQWWDGTYNGTPVQTGVYVYRYTAAGRHFPVTTGFGHVTLLRGDVE
jgi:gliding motility-associated-like protein